MSFPVLTQPACVRGAACCLLLALACLMGTSAFAASLSIRVAAGNDDAEERVSDGDMSRGSSDLELVFDGSTEQLVGMRFRSLSIPAGATISSAYIQFTVDETDSGAANVVIEGHDTGDAPRFGNSDDDISDRPRTSASVNWSIPAWSSVGAAGADQRTPDLSAILDEITSRGDWSDGNDVVFIVSGGSGCSSSACQRTAESHNGSSSRAPLRTPVSP